MLKEGKTADLARGLKQWQGVTNAAPSKGDFVSTDKKGTRILARTFFNQLRASGYNSNQIIGIATELLDLVTTDLKEADKGLQTAALAESASELAPAALAT